MPKKILYLITQSELGGAQKYVLDLTMALQDEYEIIVAFGEQGAEGELAKKLKPTKAIYYTIHHLKRDISPLNDFLATFEIANLISRLKPDIIHLNSSKISILGSLAMMILPAFTILDFNSKILNLKSKIIYTVHGWVFNEPLPAWLKSFYKFAEKFTAVWKDKFICVSNFDYQTALKEKITPERKLITIHNGIEPINFLPRSTALQKLESLINLKSKISNQKLIVSIGNLYPTKDFSNLIRATKILVSQGLDVKTIIIGEGNERARLEGLIEVDGMSKNVFLPGRIENAASLLPAFDVYACSSVKEGLSYTLIEAMRAGLPIVATKVGGNPELIKDNVSGLLAKSGDPVDLAAKIKILLTDTDLANRLKTETQTAANLDFTLEKMVAATKNIYDL